MSSQSSVKAQSELCKLAWVKIPDEPTHITWSFNGSQMFTTTQEPAQRNISICLTLQSRKTIFGDSLYILGENSTDFARLPIAYG